MSGAPLPVLGPFRALRPAPGYDAQMVAPPYDVVSLEEARALADGRPWSFLHISRPEIDLPDGTDPYAPEVYDRGAQAINRMIAEGILIRDPEPLLYVYRITTDGHSQTGIVGAASVADYDANRIRKHEFTRPAKEDDRVRQINAVNAQTGPVLLAHKPNRDLSRIGGRVAGGEPAHRVRDAAGAWHEIWPVRDPADIVAITQIFAQMEALYIADGHHRSAAASRVAAKRGGTGPHNGFLAVSFPSDEMRILPYNRVVKDLAGLSRESLVAALRNSFDVVLKESPVIDCDKTQYGMYCGGDWYLLKCRSPLPNDPKASLDVSLLADRLLSPILDVGDPRTESRIDFVGGSRGAEALMRRVDDEGWAVAFSLHPTGMEELMAVAEAGEVMPPKSTWFDPKLLDGLLSNPLD